jgi:two-component system CheB/CheR fusion protein
MPQNAIDTGAGDFVLPPGEIPSAIMRHVNEPAEAAKGKWRKTEPSVEARELAAIFKLLQRAYNLDFTKYKPGTVGRRIRRRMNSLQMEEVPAYGDLLSGDQDELDLLYHDLLIGVTEFFRDDKAFTYLETVIIPELFANLGPDEEMRVWSAGCATGEEAYSLAILLDEKARELDFNGRISVFATDTHKRSLESAVQGIFTRDQVAKIDPRRRDRYFTETGDGLFKVAPLLRKLVTFAQHDLTRDIPFSKLDLICCRNLLIYLKPEAQKRVLALMHFGMKVNGVLFLGGSEGIGPFADEFEALSASNKMFRKIRDLKLAVDLDSNHKEEPLDPLRADARPALQRQVSLDRHLLHDYDTLLERHMPAGVLIDGQFRIIHYFGEVARYLRSLKGRLENDILAMTGGNLHIALSNALHKVKKTGQPFVTRNIAIQSGEEDFLIDMTVDPLSFGLPPAFHYHISFKLGRPAEQAPLPGVLGESDTFEPALYYSRYLADLETELQNTRADLLSTQESLQATIEELNNANERLQATNEELQSTNEELNSANEELHSTNEELYSVNAEFERNNIELRLVNADHQNLLDNFDSGIIYLDAQMLIRKFNPASSAFFNLLPRDVGRPIEHIAYHLANQHEILDDIRGVLCNGAAIAREVATSEGRWMLCRVVPHQLDKGRVGGVVISFTDITDTKKVAQEVITLNLEQSKHVAELQKTNLRLEDETGKRIKALEELRLKEQMLLKQSRFAAMGEMFGNIAHQWRQPLNVLGLLVQEVGLSCEFGELNKELLDANIARVMEIVGQMSQTIDDFQNFAAPDKQKSRFKVGRVIEKSVKLMEQGLKKDGITLEVDSSGDPHIEGYANEYGQVFMNLLANARDALQERKTPQARITVRSRLEDGKAVVTVTDNGGGIPEEVIDRIFDAYFTTKDLGKGTGVGLFISKTIIEKSMGGRLTARNTADGAEFRIEV